MYVSTMTNGNSITQMAANITYHRPKTMNGAKRTDKKSQPSFPAQSIYGKHAPTTLILITAGTATIASTKIIGGAITAKMSVNINLTGSLMQS